MHLIAGWEGSEKTAAINISMSLFETEVLTRHHNLEGLACLNGERWVQKGMAPTVHRRIILDMDR